MICDNFTIGFSVTILRTVACYKCNQAFLSISSCTACIIISCLCCRWFCHFSSSLFAIRIARWSSPCDI